MVQSGHRIHHEDRRPRNRKIGRAFLDVCADEGHLTSFAQMLSAEKGQTAAGVLAPSVRWFPVQVVAIGRATGDNATRYRCNILALVLKRVASAT